MSPNLSVPETPRPAKRAIAWLAYVSGLSAAGHALQVASGPFIRAVNLHSTPPETARGLDEILRYLSRRFVPCGPQELEALLQGRWSHSLPGIVLSFDDGLANNAEVAAPLLERYGFTGWFCVPTGFLDCPAGAQSSFSEQCSITSPGSAMSWDQVRALGERHVIVAHGHRHRRLSASLSEEELCEEILLPKRRIEEETRCPCDTFCWVGGEEWAYSRRAAELIVQAGYKYAFMTNTCPITARTHPMQLQRSNVEAHWPMALVRFQLSGLQDIRYTGKRRRVNRLTRVATAGCA